jgi:hypothetical protein
MGSDKNQLAFIRDQIDNGGAVKALKASILVGILSAAVTGALAYSNIHGRTSRRLPDGSLEEIIACPRQDAGTTTLLWAAGAYVLTFTPTLLALRGRALKDPFTTTQPTRMARLSESLQA